MKYLVESRTPKGVRLFSEHDDAALAELEARDWSHECHSREVRMIEVSSGAVLYSWAGDPKTLAYLAERKLFIAP